MDSRRLLESWGFLVVGVLGLLYAKFALPGHVVYPVLFAVLAASGLAAVFGYARLAGGFFAVAGALALLKAFALAIGGGSLLLTAELAVLGFVAVVNGLRRFDAADDDGDEPEGGSESAVDESAD